MKRFIIISAFLMVWVASYGYTNSNRIECMLYSYQPGNGNENPKDPELQRRTPSAPLMCEISVERGVVFLSGSNPEILYFEIHDSEDVVMTFDDQESFIKTLFSMSGKVEILIATPLWHYIGYVEL